MKRFVYMLVCFALIIPQGIQFVTTTNAQGDDFTEIAYAQDEPEPVEQGIPFIVLDLRAGQAPLAKGLKKDKEERVNQGKPVPGGVEPKEKERSEIKDNNGKKVGQVIVTETVIEYTDPNQKKPKDGNLVSDKWEYPKVKLNNGNAYGTNYPGGTNPNREPQKTYGAGVFVGTESNDDNDCVDQATENWLQGDFSVAPDGIISGCFVGDLPDDHTGRTLGQTLLISADEKFCQHIENPNVAYPIEECKELGFTTLRELIDEDGPDNLDFDNDGNTDDGNGDGINDDDDYTDNQGGHCAGGLDSQECIELAGPDNIPLYPLIDEDGSGPIDNDNDGEPDEDGPNTPADEGELCQQFYETAGLEFDPASVTENGECNLEDALTKGVNKKADEKFGKNVYSTGDDSKDKWDKEYTASGHTVEYTYPLGHPTIIELTVIDTADPDDPLESNCKKNVKIGYISEETIRCSDENPSADFTISCDGLACTFTALASGENLNFEWVLDKLPQGEHGNSKENSSAYKKGEEPRTVTVTETMVVRCQPGYDYIEQPELDDENNPTGKTEVICAKKGNAGPKGLSALAATPPGWEGAQASDYAMMGFTFAPPVIEWGWKIEEEVCIFGWCFEVFYARVGYNFDIAAGLRLPVEIEATNFPTDGIQAGDDYTLHVSLTPKDFSVQEYEDFCNKHQLDKYWYIGNCEERFSFPDFLNSEDGDEFVANYDIFAGIIVRVLSIPIINWGVESSFDLAQACTMYNLINGSGLSEENKLTAIMNLATFLGDFATGDANTFYEYLKDQGILCGSFTTPYGADENGDDRTFPFPGTSASYVLYADCTKAILNGAVLTIKGKTRPICTNLILGTAGANLGIGLELATYLTSHNIEADWSTAGDTAPSTDNNVMWNWPQGETEPPVEPIGPITFDNYDLYRSLDHDYGVVQFDDFTYWLDIGVTLYANLQFGGILSPIPDLAQIEIYSFSFSEVTDLPGILPIPQHPGTGPAEIIIPVKNYGLDVLLAPNTLSLSPDQPDPFTVITTNLGSLNGSFDNYRFELTNIPDQSPPYSFTMVDNNDRDCMINGEHKGGPGKESECYSGGTLIPGAIPLEHEDQKIDAIDEDGDGLDGEDPLPKDEAWSAAFLPTPTNVIDLEPYQEYNAINLAVTPFWHGMTRPGLYPVKVIADSLESRNLLLPGLFPGLPELFGYEYDLNNHVYGRLDTFDVAFVKIEEFANPQVVVIPDQAQVLPGESTTYQGNFVNGGNMPDGMNISTYRPDFNTGGCTLTTLGRPSGREDCPYRAMVTRLPDEWIIDGFTGAYGPLNANEYEISTYGIQVPSDWAGMVDTPYELIITATSTEKPGVSNTVTVVHTVEATLESQTRYIIAEIEELIVEIEAANAQGIKTCGLYPVSIHPVSLQSHRALTLVLEGKTNQALNALSANLHIMQGAFMHGVNCKSIPDDPWRNDWIQRGQAIIDDLILATTIP